MIETFPRASPLNAKTFLSTMIKRMHFPDKTIQVDVDSEFKKHFETACQDLGLKLFGLPSRPPKLKG
jgi:hypothetical protein